MSWILQSQYIVVWWYASYTITEFCLFSENKNGFLNFQHTLVNLSKNIDSIIDIMKYGFK
ncbi:hypothetical protein BpHYR1_000707 [Brachionus plicatilis]|uniref:Uncharacterized protein n=1 Tax=Brachionus plicatilis TaxID=10195 RepID=A0A3M7T5S2_BRAPC|nr:hypothetical protein BpHYR1_000707 [Brachionus plicatilis]